MELGENLGTAPAARHLQRADGRRYLYRQRHVWLNLFNGVKLYTDQSMWPQGKLGYAPEIRGVANTNARVLIRRAGHLIYETQVPPGPFLIDDLYNTRSQGDIEVQIIETDGKSSFFVVPYAAVPGSMRPGNMSYQLAAGKVRNYYSVQNAFAEGVLQYG